MKQHGGQPMAGRTEFDSRVKRIARRAGRTPAARAAAMRRRKGGHWHAMLGFPISGLVGVAAGWGGLVTADLWLRPRWGAIALAAETPLALLSGSSLARWCWARVRRSRCWSSMLLGFTRFWHVAVAAACSFAALQAAPFVVQYWPQIAEAPPPGWMVAAFTA